VVNVAFAQPDCTYTKGSLSFDGTGLQFYVPQPSATVKSAIAELKSRQPNTRVFLSVGGGTISSWSTLSTTCIKDLVDDFGFDGVDIDFEATGDTPCQIISGGVSCPTDALSVSIATKLRAALPKGQYLLSTATFSVGMYGEGAFVNSKPFGSAYMGGNLALAKSTAGQSLDLINIMAYDAGNIATTGFDYAESYRAHKVWWRTQAIAIGVEIPPEAW
jgi:chitinase